MIGLLLMIVAFFLWLVYNHYKILNTLKFYIDQGAYPMPGYDNFILGNAKGMLEYEAAKAELKGTNKKALKPGLQWSLD